ncbi:EspA/EspE family type VII secretion system effector [Mycobacterium marinum]|uniref:EspA/EspE family type VII secretion system effector n=1 Tax=Mycobacterium marinum TaxID=1781 RepID=UPI00115CBEFF|nr:EspA/EspE family type VII secretion system effector [Mycobacterium marinum]
MLGSVICAVFASFLGGVLLALFEGDGSPPDSGAALVCGGVMFDDVCGQIGALVPGGGWQGWAAQAYSAENLAQSHHAKLMGDLDRVAGELVSSQAEDVQRMRYAVMAAIGLVAATGAWCLYLETTKGPAGQLASLKVACGVCGGVTLFFIGYLITLAIMTSRNASKLQELTQRAAALCAPVAGLADAAFSGSNSRSGSGADDTAPHRVADLPDVGGPLATTPDVGVALADLPGSPEFELPTTPTPGLPDFGVPHLPTPTLAGLPGMPDLAPGSAGLADLITGADGLPPSSYLSTMAQLPAPLGQLSGLWGAAAGINPLATTTSQQAQMISSLAQQGAHQRTTLTDQVTTNDDSDIAAAGPIAAERAPVATATGPTQQQQRVR